MPNSIWVLDQSDTELDYPTLGFLAQPDDLLSAPAAPDGRWSLSGDQGASETVQRYSTGADPSYVEPGDGHVLAWSDADNAYVPSDLSASYAGKADAVFKDKRPVALRDYINGSGVDAADAAILAAQTKAKAEGRALVVGQGTYRITQAPAAGDATITLTTEGDQAGLTALSGDGRGASILQMEVPGDLMHVGVWGEHALELDPRILVRDLTLRGPTAGAGIGLRGRNVAKAQVQNVEVDRFGENVDLRNCNSWNFHNLRSRRSRARGFMGNYVTPRDVGDPGPALENTSANHALSFTGTTLLEDNVSHGLDLNRLSTLVADMLVAQRNGGRNVWLQGVLGMALSQVYSEHSGSDGIKFGNSAGGDDASCRGGFANLYYNKAGAAGNRVAFWGHNVRGMNITLYAGSLTAAGDTHVWLEGEYIGTLWVRHSGSSAGFVKMPDGTNLPVTNEVLTMGQTDPRLVVKTSSYTATGMDRFIIASGAGTAITVPNPATTGRGRRLTIKRNDPANAITVTPAVGQIDGLTTTTLSADRDVLDIVSDGATTWHRV